MTRLARMFFGGLSLVLGGVTVVEANQPYCNYNINNPLVRRIGTSRDWEGWGSVYLGPSGCGRNKTYIVTLASKSQFTGWNWVYEFATRNTGPLPSGTYYSGRGVFLCSRFTAGNPVAASGLRLEGEWPWPPRIGGTVTIPCR